MPVRLRYVHQGPQQGACIDNTALRATKFSCAHSEVAISIISVVGQKMEVGKVGAIAVLLCPNVLLFAQSYKQLPELRASGAWLIAGAAACAKC